MSERSDDPKPGFCFGRKATVAEREPTPAPSDATLPLRRMLKKAVDLYAPDKPEPSASSYREGESVIASSHRPEPTAREWWIAETLGSWKVFTDKKHAEFCMRGCGYTDAEVIAELLHVIEYSAFEQLQRELKATDDCAHRWQTAYGEAQAALEAKEAECVELKARPATFIKLDETTEAFMQTHAAIENMKMFKRDADQARAELALWTDRANNTIKEFHSTRDELLAARAELAEMTERHKIVSETRQLAQMTIIELQRQITAARAREAKLREALERIDELSKVKHSGIQSGEIAREALKEIGDE